MQFITIAYHTLKPCFDRFVRTTRRGMFDGRNISGQVNTSLADSDRVTLPTLKILRGYEQEFLLQRPAEPFSHLDNVGFGNWEKEPNLNRIAKSKILRDGTFTRRIGLWADIGSTYASSNLATQIACARPEFRGFLTDLSNQKKDLGPVFEKNDWLNSNPDRTSGDYNALIAFSYTFPVIEPWRLTQLSLNKTIRILFEYNTNGSAQDPTLAGSKIKLCLYSSSSRTSDKDSFVDFDNRDNIPSNMKEDNYECALIKGSEVISRKDWRSGLLEFKDIRNAINRRNLTLEHTGLACEVAVIGRSKIQFNRVIVSMID